MRFSSSFVVVALAVFAAAHPGGGHDHGTTLDRAQKQFEANFRNSQALKCAPAIATFETQRMLKRSHLRKRKRQLPTSESAPAPHYDRIKNTTCVMAPEVMEGPYYINNEYVRTDLTETQTGVKLVLDIGVVDIITCTPLPNAFVELWAANATGEYGGYPAGNPTHVHTETFLRGGYYTNANGIVEITTLYPGFYESRTAHIHTMIHKDWQQHANGTLISQSGSLVHVGQFFFEETWNDKVYETLPYTTNKQPRTLNTEDELIEGANGGGYNAFIDLELLGDDISEGVLGYITVGVDTRKSYPIENKYSL